MNHVSGIRWSFVCVICIIMQIFSVTRVPKKASKFDFLFKNCKTNIFFWIFSKYLFRNELHAPFLPYFDQTIDMKKNTSKIRKSSPVLIGLIEAKIMQYKDLIWFCIFYNIIKNIGERNLDEINWDQRDIMNNYSKYNVFVHAQR